MNRQEAQAQIDAIEWYHEFDFGDGLQAKSRNHTDFHHDVWCFIKAQLDRIDFAGKSVLDIGCWDGYWSFYAERRGAARVLATDDCTQNWAGGKGLRLAHELLRSRVEINQQLSVYDLGTLKEKFDIILCLGVYYHLFDPFYAYSQIRHSCHADTLVVFEGDAQDWLREDALLVAHDDPSHPTYVPSRQVLRHQLAACYLNVDEQTWWPSFSRPPAPPAQPPLPPPPGRLGWRWRLKMCAQALAGSRNGVSHLTTQIVPPKEPKEPQAPGPRFGRLITQCRPFTGANPIHYYKPPFGLHVYDDRFTPQAKAA